MINTKLYWNERFKESDWDKFSGRDQTIFFCNVALQNFPQWFVTYIKKNQLSICDMGCAEGDAVPILSTVFNNNMVIGVDFSDEAIEKAKLMYPNSHFKVGDITQMEETYDVVFVSNVLEHFHKPFDTVHQVLPKTNQFFVMMVPYQEFERHSEHFITFDDSYIPTEIDHFSLVFHKVIDTSLIENTHWRGKQLLLIYANNENEEVLSMNLSKQKDLEKQLKEANEQIEKYKEELTFLKNDVKKGMEMNDSLQRNLEKSIDLLEGSINQFQGYLHVNDSENSHMLRNLREVQAEHQEMKDALNETFKYNKQLESQLDMINQNYLKTNQELQEVYTSETWKTAEKLQSFNHRTKLYLVSRGIRVLKRDGVKEFLRLAKKKMKNRVQQTVSSGDYGEQLKQILKKHKDKTIVIFPALVDWNIPLFQRPQHIAMNMAKEGYLYIYGSWNHLDNIDGFEEVAENCYITNVNEYDLLNHLYKTDRKRILHLYSTDNLRDYSYVQNALDRGDKVLYEYVDEIHDEISGQKIPEKTWYKHRTILENEQVYVVSTATKLYDEVKEKRTKNHILATNGVQMEHFTQQFSKNDIPEEIKHIVSKNKPIIGYFGAFAKWFDYKLVENLAEKRPDIEILLIGKDYDGSISQSNISQYENIHVVGPIDYQNLPKYAFWFDVSTVPFVLNDITDSTSPIKLFEYMALGKPIVTTGMPECRKYESVLIGENQDHFVEQVDKALSLRTDSSYLTIMNQEAIANTWVQKAKDISALLNS